MSLFKPKKNLRKFKLFLKIFFRLAFNYPYNFPLKIFNFLNELKLLKKQNIKKEFNITEIHPFLFDKESSNLKLQYYHLQDIWMFDKIRYQDIYELVDIGSNLNFVSFASLACKKVTCIDIRTHKIPLDNIEFKQGNILELPFNDESLDNLSSLSVIEHIGLGRYGDAINIEGMNKSIKEFERVLKKNSNLFISFPIGKNNIIEFNAHRICNLDFIKKNFDNFKIIDETFLFKNRFNSREEFIKQDQPNGIGCFFLKKK